MKAELVNLFAYDDWANDLMIATLRSAAAASIDLSSPLDTFAHIVAAEWIWLQRWQGRDPDQIPSWVTTPDLEQLVAEMLQVRAERIRLLETTGDAALEKIETYRSISRTVSWTLPVVEMVRHVANHSNYHRGQLAARLRSAGATPPATDYLLFAAETHGRR